MDGYYLHSKLATYIVDDAKADLASCLNVLDEDYDTRARAQDVQGDSTDDKLPQKPKEAVNKDLKIYYLVTGDRSWSVLAEGGRPFGLGMPILQQAKDQWR
jgi:phosphoserine aminotransferase